MRNRWVNHKNSIIKERGKQTEETKARWVNTLPANAFLQITSLRLLGAYKPEDGKRECGANCFLFFFSLRGAYLSLGLFHFYVSPASSLLTCPSFPFNSLLWFMLQITMKSQAYGCQDQGFWPWYRIAINLFFSGAMCGSEHTQTIHPYALNFTYH